MSIENTDHAKLPGPGHDEGSPDELMAHDSYGEPEMERDLVAPGPHKRRQKKQAVPERHNHKMQPEDSFCKEFSHGSINIPSAS